MTDSPNPHVVEREPFVRGLEPGPREMVTVPDLRSATQSSSDPASTPNSFAMPSGTVVRTESDPSLTRIAQDRNVPGIVSPEARSRRRLHKNSLSRVLSVAKLAKYRRHDRLPRDYGFREEAGKVEAVEPAFEKRFSLAREIASRAEEIELLEPGVWSVPSQTGFGRYRVELHDGIERCGCANFADRISPCKHLLAVGLLLTGTKQTPPTKKPRRRYPQNTAAYNLGQTNELKHVEVLLRELVSIVDEPPRAPGTHGPTPRPLREEVYCAILKVYSGLSGRRAIGFHQNAAEKGLLSSVPSFMISSRLLNRPEVTEILQDLLRETAFPLRGLEEGQIVAPDSTGMRSTSFGAWRGYRFGEQREHNWLKVHAIVGTKTHIIIGAIVTNEHGADSPQFADLLRRVLDSGFKPSAVVADKGYLSKANLTLAREHGIEPFIPMKSNSRNRVGHNPSPPAWRRLYHLFQANREYFDRIYHQRSNVETVFSAIKRKFGENVRSRKPIAQINEVLCKLIAYNLTVLIHEMYESGIAPQFERAAN
jgi:transposase